MTWTSRCLRLSLVKVQSLYGERSYFTVFNGFLSIIISVLISALEMCVDGGVATKVANLVEYQVLLCLIHWSVK